MSWTNTSVNCSPSSVVISCGPLYCEAIFTVASVARGYAVRRWFNARIHRAATLLAGGAA